MTMKQKLGRRLLLLVVFIFASLAQGLWAQSAETGCGFFRSPGRSLPAKPLKLRMVAYQESEGAQIVGLWKFTFVAEGNSEIPDGTIIDSGYVTWHADGTELMNSGRAPMTGSFCMGVWKQTGHYFKLNHFALSWDPSGANFVGPANIRERVRVDSRNTSYSGTFTLDQFDTSGNVLAHIVGNVIGRRITAD
jgi:hypothetical protein